MKLTLKGEISMCKYCEDFQKHNILVLRLRNGGSDPHSILSMELRRENQSKTSDVYLAVEEKRSDERHTRTLLQTMDPVVYCPFCGEML